MLLLEKLDKCVRQIHMYTNIVYLKRDIKGGETIYCCHIFRVSYIFLCGNSSKSYVVLLV